MSGTENDQVVMFEGRGADVIAFEAAHPGLCDTPQIWKIFDGHWTIFYCPDRDVHRLIGMMNPREDGWRGHRDGRWAT